MSSYKKFKDILKELFQLDQADLDFGIYRIMNQKHDEINDFLDNKLLPQVKEILSQNGAGNSVKLQEELNGLISTLTNAGMNPDEAPKVKELKAQLEQGSSVEALEHEVYSHLASFFKRYYKDGDFISLRRYKKDVYAIPYEGEEVKLHWANSDQYYIKTSEYLKNYSFKLTDGKSVRFHLVEASTEQNNNKEQNGKERKFKLYSEAPVKTEVNELFIQFTYEPQDKKLNQKKLNEDALEQLVEHIPDDYRELFNLKPTETNKKRTLLEKHLNDYTARNSFDYFIHKDLGGFLRRELDFFIKNEILFIDDINTENEIDFKTQLSKIKALKSVAEKIITFLAQLEDFQKKLWLKKKFVVASHYCITLDRIPERFYEEIAQNQAQTEEWKTLFSIHEIEAETGDMFSEQKAGFSEPLSIEFLKQHPFLVLDTKFFSNAFKENLLAEFDEIEKELTGELINSDNFHAISSISTKYDKKISCLHIDPPYNTATSGFLYKNNYEHSSWLAMMENRITQSISLLNENGSFQCHIDENEYEALHMVFESQNIGNGGTVIWDKKNPMLGRKGVATQHEYIIWRTSLNSPIYLKSENVKTIINSAKDFIKKHNGVNSASRNSFAKWISSNSNFSGGEKAYKFIDDLGKVYRGVAMGAPEYRENEKFHIPIIHPVTKKECPVPPNGWSRTPETISELLRQNEILFGKDHTVQPQKKVYLNSDSKRQISSIIQDAKSGKSYLDNLGLKFPYAHPVSLYNEILGAIPCTDGSVFMDFFAGSGTAGHSIISLNRDDKINRKFLLIEMGNYFSEITKPRIQKVIYSDTWKDGKPQNTNGSSHMFKYMELESYEDTLNNLTLTKSDDQLDLLKNDAFNEAYMLSYMLDLESKDSLLNLDVFKDPFNYKLNITRNNVMKETTIDLVETFNYLIGVHVKTMQTVNGFKLVTGITNIENEHVLIIWRNTEEKSNEDLNRFFQKMDFSTKDTEFNRIYVNGDNTLENLKLDEDKWKVTLIEEEFMTRMFDVKDV